MTPELKLIETEKSNQEYTDRHSNKVGCYLSKCNREPHKQETGGADSVLQADSEVQTGSTNGRGQPLCLDTVQRHTETKNSTSTHVFWT